MRYFNLSYNSIVTFASHSGTHGDSTAREIRAVAGSIQGVDSAPCTVLAGVEEQEIHA